MKQAAPKPLPWSLRRAKDKRCVITSKHLACLHTAGLIEICHVNRDRRTTCCCLIPSLVSLARTPPIWISADAFCVSLEPTLPNRVCEH